MVYVFILLAIAVVIGPLLSVLPSKRQRDLEVARDAAREAGVIVSVREPRDLPPRLRRATDNTLVCYSVRLVPRHSRELARDLYVRTTGGWESRSSESVPSVLSELPEGAEVLAIGLDDIRVYWDERGGLEAVQQVVDCLINLRPKPPGSGD